MEIGRIIWCISGAVIGAGFASGREITQFFSLYGHFSWPLAALSGAAMGWMMEMVIRCRSMDRLLPSGKMAGVSKILLFLLLLVTAGAMTAASGELAALTVPLIHARSLGMILTLSVCLLLSHYPLRALEHLGRLLIPILLAAYFLILRLPVESEEIKNPSVLEAVVRGVPGALCYSALNVMLASGILCEVGQGCDAGKRAAGCTGAVLTALLALGNAVILPHAAELRDQPLPMVLLLKNYGKMGYYLSALTLYLAAATTLISVLRSLTRMMKSLLRRFAHAAVWLGTMAAALCGFDRLVAAAYPALGFACLLIFLNFRIRNGRRTETPCI